jgi:GNAT superfamily N-acetyltransferase
MATKFSRDLRIRPALTDADLAAWNHVRRVVLPDEPVGTVEQMRAYSSPDRLVVLAETPGGDLVGSGIADRSNLADGFVAPRILPDHRRRGAGTTVLRVLIDHLKARGLGSVAAHAGDEGAYAFAVRHGFVEVDRQVELVRAVLPDEPAPPPYPGVEFTSVAERPDLLEATYDLACQGYADLVLTTGPAVLELEEWLRDEATLPGGSIVALADGDIVGYAGLIAWNDDDTRAENGLTVVDRAWRGRGLAQALKRRQLAWASANGIRELVTWTQQGNDAMRQVNLRLDYEPRAISRTVRRDLP